jgi:hypothetical protein
MEIQEERLRDVLFLLMRVKRIASPDQGIYFFLRNCLSDCIQTILDTTFNRYAQARCDCFSPDQVS